MNKTITINLAGINFYIDEDAYSKLDKYLKAIAVSLDAESRQETMQDIEARIAELFLEPQKENAHVIEMGNIDEMIKIMGQPEDYQIDEEKSEAEPKRHKTTTSKKLYRDIGSRVLGGVCSGLSHYLGFSKVWIRVIFLLLFIPGFTSTLFLPSGSTVFLIYIILWIVVPGARTTSEKLEMQGKKIDIDNIKRKVKEDYADLKNKVGNSDYSGTEHFFEKSGNFLLAILKVIAVIIGVMIVLVAGGSLIAILLSFVTLGAFSIGGFDPISSTVGIYNHLPQWLSYLLILLLSGIPFLLLLLAGIKIISPHSRPIRLTGVLVLAGIWILALIPLLLYGANWKALNSSYFYNTETKKLNISAKDTLYLQPYSSRSKEKDSFSQFAEKNAKIYSTAVKFDLSQTDLSNSYMTLNKSIKGYALHNDISTKDMVYNTSLKNDTLYIDSEISFPIERHDNLDYQRLHTKLYIPENAVFSIDKSLSFLFKNIPEELFNHYLHFEEREIKCLDCTGPQKENTVKKEWYQEKDSLEKH